MIKDLGFFFFHNLLWVLPLSSKQHFDQVGFWFVQVWSSLHVKANGKVLSFSHLCHCFFFFFYFSWCGLLPFYFYFLFSFIYLFIFSSLLLLVLCFKNSTVHICLKIIEDALFFLHLVTYACNTLMYFKNKIEKDKPWPFVVFFSICPFWGLGKILCFPLSNAKMLGFCGE